jgi:thioredoxin
MKRTGIIIISALALLLAGGLIIVWSYHNRADDTERHASVNLKSFTDENFQTEVVDASKTSPILVDFYADWCFPCRMLEPILEDVANELQGKAIIGKINTEKNMIARKFQITKIPAVFIIKNGEVTSAFYGVVPKETIVKALLE